MGKMIIKKVGFFVLLLVLILVITGCNEMTNEPKSPIGETQEPAIDPELGAVDVSPEPVNIEPEVTPYTTEAKILAVGDVMMHNTQISAGYNASTKSYNFEHFFSEVKEILSQGDWVIGNLETTTAGEDLKYTGYPMFNAPTEIIDALKEAGFNVLTHANNHTLDRKEVGVIRTRDSLEERGILTHGTARSVEESEEILLLEKNEIKLALMAYTYGTNGIPIPAGKDYLVNLIDEQKMIQDIERARGLGADVVAVSLHFGVEYQLKPNQEQINLAHNLIRAGADIILGSHPHVVQPYEVVEIQDDKGMVHKGIVVYSMGNFISAQNGEDKNLGMIFGLTIRKHFPEGTIEIADVNPIPTWVQHYKIAGKTQYRVLPLANKLEQKDDSLLSSNDYKNMERYLQKMNQHIESMAPVDKRKLSQ